MRADGWQDEVEMMRGGDGRWSWDVMSGDGW